MTKKIIGIDIDDVLSSQVDTLIDFANSKHGMNLTVDNFKAPGEYWTYFENLSGIDPKHSTEVFEDFISSGQSYNQIISEEAIKAIKKLKSMGYRLEIITSRSLEWQKGTEDWLEKHLPETFDNVHFVELWNKGDEKATKAKICQEIGAGYLIDDNPEHCNLADEAGVKALLFGQWGWNMFHEVNQGVIRVKNWAEVLNYFHGQAKS